MVIDASEKDIFLTKQQSFKHSSSQRIVDKQEWFPISGNRFPANNNPDPK